MSFLLFLGAYQRKIPKINEKVAVKSLSKNQFVRACILEKVNNTTYSVNFVDYGGKENIKNNEIFVLPYRFRYVSVFFILGIKFKFYVGYNFKLLISCKMCVYFSIFFL